MASRALALLIVLIGALQFAPARAESSPEETCTIAAAKRSGEECIACSAWDGDEAKCLKRLSRLGYQQRCRGSGTRTWSEVWCRSGRKLDVPPGR